MNTPRQLAGGHRRSLRALREKILTMAQAWDGIDQFNMNELTDLADRIEGVSAQMIDDEKEVQV